MATQELVHERFDDSQECHRLLHTQPSALASTYGSVEPIASSDVIDIGPLKAQRLDVRAAFAERLLQCGIVDQVIAVLVSTRSITTINGLNTHIEVGAGGFFGETNPSYVFTIIDSGPNAASHADIKVLTDSLGFVLSQTSAFLLDVDQPDSFDFPNNYVVLNFDTPPPLRRSAALFETVGRIDPELFSTNSSGYTQFGRAYLSLQSFVPDEQFISGLRTGGPRVRRRVHPACRRSPGIVPGWRRVSRQRLGPEPARRGVSGPDPRGESSTPEEASERPLAFHARRAAEP